MSISPKVDFTFENNNVVQSTPSLGVSFVYAATSKGPVNDASKVIGSVAEFRRTFGQELNNSSISQIERALKAGSLLRICRVAAASSVPGTISGATVTIPNIAEIGFRLKNPFDTMGANPTITFKEVSNKTYLVLADASGELENIYLYSIKGASPVALSTPSLVTFMEEEDTPAPVVADVKPNVEWDIDGLVKFNKLSQYLQIYIKEDFTDQNVITDTVQLYDYLNANNPADLSFTTANGTITPGTYVVPSKAADYSTEAIETLLDYNDVYQVAFSGINTLLKNQSEIRTVHGKWAEIFVPLQEYTLYIEVPSIQNVGIDNPITPNNLIAWVNDHIGAIGNSKYIAYFAGGNKVYDNQGMIRDCDAIGAILGLGDTSATTYGPWKSFAGMNRGIIADCLGPVIPNYGSPSRYEQLNEFAQAYMNMIVIKDTPAYGKQPLLWHLFTSQFKQDSERFLSIVRLNLYLKKTLRPILEKYIEEPNHWTTWKSIYLEVKPILDYLVEAEAMSTYSWQGDQDANSYRDLTINNEADVRQGKYKVQLRYKDIVPMQEITINIVIDAAEQTVAVNLED